MLPEQRSVLASWFNRLRGSRQNGNRKVSKSKRELTRLTRVEPLEDRRVLTANLYVDFGTLLGSVSLPIAAPAGGSGWNTLGQTVSNTEAQFNFGPLFDYSNNYTVTYSNFASVVNAAYDQGFRFNPGPVAADDPYTFQTGPQLPIDPDPKVATVIALEVSIVQELQRIFTPYDINVVPVAENSLANARALMSSDNRLTDPNEINKNPQPANLYNLTNQNPAGFVPPGFTTTVFDPVTGAPLATRDAYIMIGAWTRGGAEVGDELGIMGAAEPGLESIFADMNDPMFPGAPIEYSDGGGAVMADTIMDAAMAGQVQFNVAVASVAAQMTGIIYSTGEDATGAFITLNHSSSGEASVNNPFFNSDVDLLSSSDVMREGPKDNLLPIPTGQELPFFTRMPLMVGDLNQDPTVTQNAYDYLTSDLDVGAQTGTDLGFLTTEEAFIGEEPIALGVPFAGNNIMYVTGTGAYDHISLTNDAANPGMILVTIDSYRNTTDTPAFTPDALITSFSYDIDPTVPAGALGDVLLIECGSNNDQVDIDPTIAGLSGVQVEIFGGGGVNNISMDDALSGTSNGDDVSVTPSNLQSLAFSGIERFDNTITVSNATALTATTYRLQEFQDDSIVHLEGFNSLTYNMPEFLGDDFTLTGVNGSSLAFPPTLGGTDMVIDGTAGGANQFTNTFGFTNIEFTNIPTVTLTVDAAALPFGVIPVPLGATNDSLSIDSTGGYADGLQSLTVALGPGNDSLTVKGSIDFTPDTLGGTFIYDGGTGTDSLTVSADTDWTLTDTGITDALGNSIQFLNTQTSAAEPIEIANVTGGIAGGASHTFTVDGWSGTATLTSLAGGDTFNIGDTSPVTGNLTINTSGVTGDTFNIDSFTGTGTVTGDDGDDVFNVNTNDITISKAASGSGTITAYAGTAGTTFNLTTTTLNGGKTAKLTSTAGLTVGEDVVGPLVPAGTKIAAIVNTTTITLSAPATAAGVTATLIGVLGTTILPVSVTTTSGSTDVTISSITGLANGDTIVGANFVAGTTIHGIANLILDGAAGNDTFNLGSSASPVVANVSLNGGDEDDDTDTNTFNVLNFLGNFTGNTITGGAGNNVFNVGTASMPLIYQNLSLEGGAGVDQFNINNWSGSGTLDGNAGDDVFNIGGAGVAVSANLSVNGDTGNDQFYVTNWTGSGTLNGGDGNDQFFIGTQANTPAGSGNIEQVTQQHTIIGGNGADSVTLDDSGTPNTVNVNYDIDANDVKIDPATPAPQPSPEFGGIVFDSSLESLTLIASQGANTVTVTPNKNTAFTLDGQDPTNSPGDVLNLNLAATAGVVKATPGAGGNTLLSFTSGQKAINFKNFETVPNFALTSQQQQQNQQQQQQTMLQAELTGSQLIVEGSQGGSGSTPLIKVYAITKNTVTGADQETLLFSFLAYESTYTGGVRVTTADVIDPSTQLVTDVDLITAPGTGRAAEVKVFSGDALIAGAATTGNHLVSDPDAALLSGGTSLTVNTTGTTTNANVTVGLFNQPVTGPNISAGTTVLPVSSSSVITLSSPALATATVTATIGPAVVSLKLTKGKATATVASVLSIGGLVAGQSVFGSNNFVVAKVTAGSRVLQVTSASTLAVGELVSGTGIPMNATITSIVGTNVTLSAAATVTNASVSVAFDPIISNTKISTVKFGAGGFVTLSLSNKVFGKGAVTINASGFFPEGSTYTSGLYVAAGELDGNPTDGYEIVTTRSTGVPEVRVFNSQTQTPYLTPDLNPVAFNPYTTKFTTGAQVAVGNVDGTPDIVTVPGANQTVQVEVFDFNAIEADVDNHVAITPARSFLGFESTYKAGSSLGLSDVNGDGFDEIVLGAGSNGGSRIRVLDDFGTLLNQYKAFTTGNINAPLEIVTENVGGTPELFVAQGITGKTHLIEGFDPLSGKLIDSFLESDPALVTGVFLG